MEGIVPGSGTPIFEEWRCRRRGNFNNEGRSAGARLVTEEFAINSETIRGGAGLAAIQLQVAVVTKDRKLPSVAFIVCIRENMEDLAWVSAVLGYGVEDYERQPDNGPDGVESKLGK